MIVRLYELEVFSVERFQIKKFPASASFLEAVSLSFLKYFAIDIAFCGIGFGKNLCRISNNNGIGWDIEIYIGVRGYQYIVSNDYSSYDYRIGSYPDLIANDGNTRFKTAVLLSYGNALCNIAVFPDLRLRIDNEAAPMP